MTTDPAMVAGAERWIWWAFPRLWRQDGRAEDMITTAREKADDEGRSELGPIEITDLTLFGLRMRAAPWWQSAPWLARTITGWAGVLGGMTLATAATIRPWVATSDQSDPVGLLPWPALVLALWCLLAVGVVAGSAPTVRAAAAGVLIVLPASLLSAAPTLTPGLTGSSPTAGSGPLLLDPDLAWSTTFYVGLPIWMCACLALGAAPVVHTVAPIRATLAAAAAVTGAALVQVDQVPNQLGWFGAPGYMGPFAVAILISGAAITVVLFAARPRSAPAAMIAAGPWLLPASVTLIGPAHLAVVTWILVWFALTTAAAITWRRGLASSPRPM